MAKSSYVRNQVFLGIPAKNVKAHYEKIIANLAKKYAVSFIIVGRNDGQSAEDLLSIITDRLDNSSSAIFDATGGNPNVSLEFGFAEALDIPRSLFLSTHAAATPKSSPAIIADLGGKRRVQYKTESGLEAELTKFCKAHPYTVRFETAQKKLFRNKGKGEKKRLRSLSLKIIHRLDGREEVRRDEIVQGLEAEGYQNSEVESTLKKLHLSHILSCSAGRYSVVTIA